MPSDSTAAATVADTFGGAGSIPLQLAPIGSKRCCSLSILIPCGRAYSAWMPRLVCLAFLGLAPQAVISCRGFVAPPPFETALVAYQELLPDCDEYDSKTVYEIFENALGTSLYDIPLFAPRSCEAGRLVRPA